MIFLMCDLKRCRYFLVTKCESVASPLDSEVNLEGGEAKRQKLDHSPKQEFVAKSASQIITEQRGK